jgi:hypothetical protein
MTNFEQFQKAERAAEQESQAGTWAQAYVPMSASDNHAVKASRGHVSSDTMAQFGTPEFNDHSHAHHTKHSADGHHHAPHKHTAQTEAHEVKDDAHAPKPEGDQTAGRAASADPFELPETTAALNQAEAHFKQGQKTHDYRALVHDMAEAKQNMLPQDYDEYLNKLNERLHKDGMAENLRVSVVSSEGAPGKLGGILSIDDTSNGNWGMSSGRFDKDSDDLQQKGILAPGDTAEAAHGRYQANVHQWEQASNPFH